MNHFAQNTEAAPAVRFGMTGATKGLLLGLANTVIVGLCMAAWSNEGGAMFFFVLMLGVLPAAVVGSLLGVAAERYRNAERRLVLVVMIAFACLSVLLLGDFFGLYDLALVSCIPTAAMCSVLERWTRAPEELPPARIA